MNTKLIATKFKKTASKMTIIKEIIAVIKAVLLDNNPKAKGRSVLLFLLSISKS